MVTAQPSLYVIALVVVGIAIFLLGGGVYDLIVSYIPIAYGLGPRRVLFFYPRRVHEQVFLESITVMTIYGIGIAGFLLTYHSTKYAYRPRQAFMLLLIGCVLIIIAYLYIENIMWMKMSGPL